ncbi:TOM (translocase of outer membrane) complex component [Fusarium oxysporum]|nr:TOM (translocase of outer membrane) complex component [Fusarium oxysporum]
MSGPIPSMAPGQPTYVPVDSSSGLWERLTHWASENKTVVYTIAGVGIAVTGAGVIYYLNDNSGKDTTPKLSKKERRKRKEADRKADKEAPSSGPLSTQACFCRERARAARGR